MKNKIILLLVLFILFMPAVSHAVASYPVASLTIRVNTQGSDSFFVFLLRDCVNNYCDNWNPINLQTQDLSATKTMWITAYAGQRFRLKQNSVPGLRISNIFCTSDNPNDVFWYQSDYVSFSPINRENITCTFNNVKERNPVLIIPGILGTEMFNGSEKLWPDTLRMITDASDSFMDPLGFNDDLTPINSVITKGNVLRKEATSDYTEGLINEFEGQGYVENETLFTFPYDWRYGESGKYADGTTNVDLLKQKIESILQQTGSDKIDVIAHSNGGLLVKKYVMDNPASHKINKAVFVGVPNIGAPKAVKALVQGDSMGISFAGLGLAESEMKKIAENMPVSYDLLPSQTYYNVKGSPVSQIDIGFGIGEPSEKDLSYSEFKSYLGDNGFNLTATENSEDLHSTDFDNYDLRAEGIDLYNVVGCKTATMTNFLEVKSKDILGNEHTDYANVELKTGDGTVPIESATNLPINQANKFYTLQTKHSGLLSSDGSRQEIVNLISGSSLPLGNNLVTQDLSKCQLNGKAISVFSPVNIFVTDQNGNRMGLADDGSVINEIPGADFEMLGEHKFIYLPQDNGQVYNISLKGTGNGTFTIKSQDINNSQIIKTEVFSNLPVTTSLTGQMNISSGQATLSLNNSPAPVLPSATLDALESEDFLPPVATATLTGEFMMPEIYKESVEVKIKAKDANSGVLAVQYNLDNLGYQKTAGDTADFVVLTEGKHAVIFFATDKAGNNSPEQIINFEIKKLPTDKNQCKKDGWKNYGKTFKNQGDCVSFVERKK
jgi:pimeloyl-ACP methyl ester carboxylesterase